MLSLASASCFVTKQFCSIHYEFPLLVPILILLSDCINSSSLFTVAILCTLLHRENTSFEVWYLQAVSTQRVSLFCRDLHLHLNWCSCSHERNVFGTCFLSKQRVSPFCRDLHLHLNWVFFAVTRETCIDFLRTGRVF